MPMGLLGDRGKFNCVCDLRDLFSGELMIRILRCASNLSEILEPFETWKIVMEIPGKISEMQLTSCGDVTGSKKEG